MPHHLTHLPYSLAYEVGPMWLCDWARTEYRLGDWVSLRPVYLQDAAVDVLVFEGEAANLTVFLER